jgi:hypothetical protein
MCHSACRFCSGISVIPCNRVRFSPHPGFHTLGTHRLQSSVL